jgi:hypothetical protein
MRGSELYRDCRWTAYLSADRDGNLFTLMNVIVSVGQCLRAFGRMGDFLLHYAFALRPRKSGIVAMQSEIIFVSFGTRSWPHLATDIEISANLLQGWFALQNLYPAVYRDTYVAVK